MADLRDGILPTYFGAFEIIVAEPGTVIRDEATGQELTVEEGQAVCKRNRMWVTPTVFKKLKEHPDLRTVPVIHSAMTVEEGPAAAHPLPPGQTEEDDTCRS